jgi:hypothetical protein
VTSRVTLLAALYTSVLFRSSFVVLVVVFSVLVANQSAPKVCAVLEPAVIVAGVAMILSGIASRHLRRARRDWSDAG